MRYAFCPSRIQHLLTGLILLLTGQQVLAQQAAAIHLALPADAIDAVRISSFSAHADLSGVLATTTLELVVRNDTDQDLEGTLAIPLLPGQQVISFAMDIDGELRTAVAVPRAQARKAYENIRHEAIDPGLLEKDDDGFYRLSLYPLQARSEKRVRIVYQEFMLAHSGEYRYALPLNILQDQIPEFKLSVRVHEQAFVPELLSCPVQGLNFQRQKGGYLAETAETFFSSGAPLSLLIPMDDPVLSLAVERNMDRSYFLAEVPVPEGPIAKKLPRRIQLYWDASGSAMFRDREAELALLDAYFAEIGDFDLLWAAFSDTIRDRGSYRVQNGDWQLIRAQLAAIEPDGPTCLGCLDFQPRKVDEILLVSEGVGTEFSYQPQVPSAPLYLLAAAGSAPGTALWHQARSSGGAYLNLQVLPQPEALERLTRLYPMLVGIKYPTSKVREMSPSGPTPLQEQLLLSGQLVGRHASIKARIGYAGKVVRKVKLHLQTPADGGIPGPRTAWARMRLADLEGDPSAHAEEILELGMAHQLPTSQTSLLVLERLEDYVRFRIPPPEELRAAYAVALEKALAAEAYQDSIHQMEQQDYLSEVLEEYTDWMEFYQFGPDGPPADAEEPGEQRGPRAPRLYSQPEIQGDTLRTLRGQVLGEDGEALAFATIRVKNRNHGTNCDAEGHFKLVIEAGDTWLQVSWGGLKEEFLIENLSDNPILVLAPGIQLSEVVISEVPSLVMYSEPAPLAALDYREVRSKAYSSIRELPDPGAPGQRNTASGFSGLILVDGIPSDTMPALPRDEIISMELVESPTAVSKYGPHAMNGLLVITTIHDTSHLDLEDLVQSVSWDTSMPYLEALRQRPAGQRYDAYLNLRSDYLSSTSFFIDVADFFYREGPRELAPRVLGNLLETGISDPEVLRSAAMLYLYMGEDRAAEDIYQRLLILRPFEPQSARDLGLLYARQGRYDEAVELLLPVVTEASEEIDDLYWGIQLVALTELNGLRARFPEVKALQELAEPLRYDVDMDLRVVIDWSRIDTDIDLWIDEPGGLKTGYDSPESANGGHLSEDMVDGYGPESYWIRKAPPGEYVISLDYFDEADYNLTGATYAKIEVFRNFGRPNQTQETYIVRLEDPEQKKVEVCRIQVK